MPRLHEREKGRGEVAKNKLDYMREIEESHQNILYYVHERERGVVSKNKLLYLIVHEGEQEKGRGEVIKNKLLHERER